MREGIVCEKDTNKKQFEYLLLQARRTASNRETLIDQQFTSSFCILTHRRDG